MKRALIALLVTLLLAGLAAPPAYAGGRQAALRWVADHIRPCPQEDSRNCFWDAKNRGNKKGRSLVDLNGKKYFLR